MDTTIDKTTFADLGLRPEILSVLSELGYEEPTPIQAEAIPPLIEGRDLLGNAATGTGKTAAFALPILERLGTDASGGAPRALVLVPTRELAMQVSEAIHRYGRGLGTRVLPIYGGQPIIRQLKALERGVDVVVATPGRARDHVGRGTLVLDCVRVVVLDEADEMLDMGFAEDIGTILGETPDGRQTVLFSATMPPRIAAIARTHLTDPVRVQIPGERAPAGEAPRVRRSAHVVQRTHRPAALGRVLDAESPTAAIVFCRTRIEVESLVDVLNGRGYRAKGPARRHGPGAARSGDGPPSQWLRRAPRGHRRRGARPRRGAAHPRHQLRRPIGPRCICPSHRGRRACRARGRGDHAGRAL